MSPFLLMVYINKVILIIFTTITITDIMNM